MAQATQSVIGMLAIACGRRRGRAFSRAVQDGAIRQAVCIHGSDNSSPHAHDRRHACPPRVCVRLRRRFSRDFVVVGVAERPALGDLEYVRGVVSAELGLHLGMPCLGHTVRYLQSLDDEVAAA